MVINGRTEYKKAVILTSEKMHDLQALIQKYCDRVCYKATTIGDSEISFSSLDELLQYDNFGSRSIKTLHISASGKTVQSFRLYFEADILSFGFTGYSETFHCYYEVETVDIETNLRDEINTFLRKITAEYWLIAKFRLFGLLMLFCYIALVYMLLHKISIAVDKDIVSSIISTIVSLFIGFGIVVFVKTVDQKFFKRCFPPIAFVWGEGKTQFEKSQRLRGNLFWGLIIAVIAGVIATFISNYLF